MTKAKIFIDSFMEKLNTNGFNKDNQPDNGPELTAEFINKQVESYTSLIKAEVFKLAAK